jgi:hypothetical protein
MPFSSTLALLFSHKASLIHDKHTMRLLNLAVVAALGAGSANCFQLAPNTSSQFPLVASGPDQRGNKSFHQTAAATAALAILLVSSPPALASPTAAQISLDSVPPTTISVQIGDLPVVGSLLSGTYTKVDSPVDKPSVTIKSPQDKIKAIQAAATTGHLEFDVGGKMGITTHLDVDVAADEAGVAKIRVSSGLIPKLPFKNAASSVTAKGKASQWSIVTNLGNGESYYFNTKTGETQFEKPDKI